MFAFFSGAVIIGAICAVVLMEGSRREEERTRAEEVLSLLLARNALLPDVQETLGVGRSLNREQALLWARRLALNTNSTLSKIQQYPRAYIHTVTANVTCFVFYDDGERLVDYELGIQ